LPKLDLAGHWFAHSGIQTPSGGVARYYLTGPAQNLPVSTEISGYSVSTFVYLHSATGDARYLENAGRTARFLADTWRTHGCMPFEVAPAEYTYFFDCGIITRGLLAAWRALGLDEYRDVALAIGHSMVRDFFNSDGEFHPILALPAKTPAIRDAARWSRWPGCYQLKSAMAWHDLYQISGEKSLLTAYEHALDYALRNATEFLPGSPDPLTVMDRLHPFAYFLEGLMPRASDPVCAQALDAGIRRLAATLREIAPRFERCDVYAQLLRARLFADALGAVPLDRAAAQWEAARLAEFQVTSDDPRIHGGYYFGRREGAFMPYVNPVSTAFALQALNLLQNVADQPPGNGLHLHLLI
jgi:hypothetical protein